MPTLKIEVDLSDDALAHDEWGCELKLLLQSVVEMKVLGMLSSGLFDTNGNKVGGFEIK